MAPDEEVGTPPNTPPRKRRTKKSKRRKSSGDDASRRRRSQSRKVRRKRASSQSSSDDEEVPRKMRKTASSFSTKDILKLIKTCSGENSRSSFNNNLNNVIPEFDPSNRAQTIESWLRKVNECAVIYNWDEKQVVHFSLQKLVGLAKRWFEALPTVIYTWSEWQEKLRKAFPSEENYGRLLEESHFSK